MPEKIQNATITGHLILDLCLSKTQAGKYGHDYRILDVFEKLRFQNAFCPD